MDVQFAGEHLLPGKLGQFFIILSFGTALLSAISYYFATLKDTLDNSWQRIGRIALWINTIAVIGIGSCLFYIIFSHYFEYNYAYAHSSRDLPTHFILSSFWEDQEGSFWLWTFWQAVLANILVWKAKSWENSVLTVVMFSQVFLASMLLGVEILGIRIGSSPFILLRDAMRAPIFSRPDYLSLIEDGAGMNPLLRNYWMVIHPPTLFLGFGSMVVPFAYAVAGLWEKRYSEWMKPAMPWTLFGCMILGAGIIMGSFWAYEALNFGGFWAWDPVENASIIPWITLIAGVHVMLAYRSTGHSYFTATFLVLISFILVLYASFLTRSGILGDTSVHAFGDAGMMWQLILYLCVFVVLMIVILIVRFKEMPITKKDEETYSREFWLFIGALVLTVACVQIMATTSIPVFNAIFGTKVAPPSDVIQHFNKWQVPFAVVVALISGLSQFLKYKDTQPSKFFSGVGIAAGIALLVSAGFVYITELYTNFMFMVLTFAGVFSIVANLKLLVEAFKGKWKLAGSSVAHIGFGLILVGALVAAAKNKVISINNSGIIPVKDFEKVGKNKPGENLMLYQNKPVKIDKYTVTYLSDSTVSPNTYYKVNYKVIDEKTGKITEEFNLYPNAQQNPKFGLVASPDTRHYLTYDIYTHATAAPPVEEKHDDHEGHSEEEGFEKPIKHEVSPGDTVKTGNGFIVIKGVNRNAKIKNITLGEGDIAVGLKVEVVSKGKSYASEPLFLVKGGNKLDFGKNVEEAGLRLRFSNIYPDRNKLELTVYQKPAPEPKWIVMKAVLFPYINLFWGGTIIMVIGFLLSIFRRSKELKAT